MNSSDIFAAIYNNSIEDVEYFLEQDRATIEVQDGIGRTPLHVAASKGRLEILKFLISKGAEIDALANDNKTALHFAAQGGSVEIVNLLLSDKRICINAQDKDGRTPLHSASATGNLGDLKGTAEVVAFLISKKADVNTKDNSKYTPLHSAVFGKHIEAAKILLSVEGIEVNTMCEAKRSSGDIRRSTPLHDAVFIDNVGLVNILVSKGADVGVKNDMGSTPFDMAKYNGNIAIIDCLSGKGIQSTTLDDELSEIETVVSECEKELQSGALCVESVVQHMLNAPTADMTKAQVYAKEFVRVKGAGRIDVHRLARLMKIHSDDSRVRELGSRAAKCYLQLSEIWLAASNRLMTPDFKSTMKIPSIQEELNKAEKMLFVMGLLHTDIFSVIKHGNVEDVRQFVEEKSGDINVRNKVGSTALHFAVLGKNIEVIKYLVSAGMDVNIKGESDSTPLDIAACAGNIEAAKFFISKRADVNTKTSHGLTPLHGAAMISGSVEIGRILVQAGADVNARDSNNITPLHSAVMGGHIEIAKYLVSEGADVNAKTSVNDTPFDKARKVGHLAMIQYLLPLISPEERERHITQEKRGKEEQEHRESEERERIAEQEQKARAKYERREAKEREQQRIAATKKRRATIGLISQIAVTAVYLFILFGTDMVSTLWLAGGFIRLLPFAGFSLVVGVIGIVFLRKANYGSGLIILIGMVLVQSIAASVWAGNVGFLFLNLIGRAVLNILSAIPGAILVWKEMP